MTEDTLLDEEVAEELAGLPSTQVEYLRDVAKHDLYTLSKGILGYQDVDEDVHGGFCLFIQSEERRRRLLLMPRAHLKSTLGTVADSIRITLEDPIEARTLIVNEVEETASDFITEIKNHWEKNVVLKGLFPELVPTRTSGPGVTWGSTEALLPVEGRICKEPHWRALGVGGALTGQHFRRIKCDDLIGFKSAHSPSVMASTIKWNGNITPLLVNQHTDVIDWIGTRWSRNDLYADLMKGYGSSLAVYTRQAIEDGVIIFPALHTWEEYNYLQTMQPQVWQAQYCNNPLEGGNSAFPAGAVSNYYFSFDGAQVIVQLPYEQYKVWDIYGELDRVITVDPNSGALDAPDTAAIVVTGVSPDDEVFVLESWSGRVSPSDLIDKLFQIAKRWRPRVVGIEKAGQQNTQHYFEKKIELESFSVRVEPVSHGNKAKIDRIRGNLEPVIRSGRLFLQPAQQVLRQQISEFPDCTGDIFDEVDALAYGPELWRKPMSSKQQKLNKDAHKLILKKRNKRTGY